MKIVNGFVIQDVVVGDSDWTTLFHVFDFAIVALAAGLGIKGAIGAMGKAIIAKSSRGDNGNSDDLAWEFVLEGFVFGPRIEAVKDDAFLTGGDKVFGLGDGLASNPIFAFSATNHFTESFFAPTVGGALDAAFGHFLINHTTKVDFWGAVFGKVVNNNGFTATSHTDNSKNFYV